MDIKQPRQYWRPYLPNVSLSHLRPDYFCSTITQEHAWHVLTGCNVFWELGYDVMDRSQWLFCLMCLLEVLLLSRCTSSVLQLCFISAESVDDSESQVCFVQKQSTKQWDGTSSLRQNYTWFNNWNIVKKIDHKLKRSCEKSITNETFMRKIDHKMSLSYKKSIINWNAHKKIDHKLERSIKRSISHKLKRS